MLLTLLIRAVHAAVGRDVHWRLLSTAGGDGLTHRSQEL